MSELCAFRNGEINNNGSAIIRTTWLAVRIKAEDLTSGRHCSVSFFYELLNFHIQSDFWKNKNNKSNNNNKFSNLPPLKKIYIFQRHIHATYCLGLLPCELCKCHRGIVAPNIYYAVLSGREV